MAQLPHTNEQSVHGPDSLLENGLNNSFLLGDGPSDGPEFPAIDPAMENFLAEYLQGDQGWDPFCELVSYMDCGFKIIILIYSQ